MAGLPGAQRPSGRAHRGTRTGCGPRRRPGARRRSARSLQQVAGLQHVGDVPGEGGAEVQLKVGERLGVDLAGGAHEGAVGVACGGGRTRAGRQEGGGLMKMRPWHGSGDKVEHPRRGRHAIWLAFANVQKVEPS